MVSSLISSIQGSLESVGPDRVDISVGGVTFQINVPASSADGIGRVGDHVRLFTSLQVREDSLTLYGFISEEARTAFETLIGISGIGPKVALSVLSRFTPASLAVAVSAADTDAFVGVPGVGKKTAGRIILELKGKLAVDWAVDLPAGGDGDVFEALTALGYTVSEAREAVSSINSDDALSVEDKVRLALQQMAGG